MPQATRNQHVVSSVYIHHEAPLFAQPHDMVGMIQDLFALLRQRLRTRRLIWSAMLHMNSNVWRYQKHPPPQQLETSKTHMCNMRI